MSKQILSLTVNGEKHELAVEPRDTLLEVLREQLGLTGTKEGCSNGECGSCTVLLDRKPILACLTLAVDAGQKEVETIEGVAVDGELHPVQRAFVERGAIQCGFCTPGMVIAAKALLERHPDPTRQEIDQAMGAHLCRCTGYVKIVDAVEKAAREIRERQVT